MTSLPSQPFALPTLSLPTDARLNLHRAAASGEAVAWARRTGVIGTERASSVWTERDLRDHDYGLMCAYIHPDADAGELTLITQWYTWVFFFDDNFLARFKKPRDRDGATAHLDRLTGILSDGVAPDGHDTDPAAAGLADLWQRTVRGMSDCWRRRFAKAMVDLLQESLSELDSIAAGRVPDPIEYIELRRRVGGAPWSATLVEHAVGEFPARLVDSRPFRVLTESFADAVHLRNDLFSYQREIGHEGEPHNAVLVAERFLGWPPQRAAQLVADLITSRLRLFERVAAAETPELLADRQATVEERRRVWAYVQGLRDWQAGGHEWHRRSTRYMNFASRSHPVGTAPVASGPGTSSARLVRPVTGLSSRQTHAGGPQPVLRQLPRLPVPFPVRISPHLEHIRSHAVRWAEELGLCEPVPGVPHSHVWTATDVVDFDIALCACAVFPDATVDELELVCNWLHLTYIDDYFPAVYGHAERATAKEFLASLATMLAPPGVRPAPCIPAQRLMADLWDRTTRPLTPAQREPIHRAALTWLWTHLWEHHHNHTRQVPDPVDFVEMGRSTFGSDFMIEMIRGRHPEIPPEVHDSTPMVMLDKIVCDLFRLMNDLVSYPKETEFEGETVNGLIVFGRFLRLADAEAAATTVTSLLRSRLARWERLTDHDIPALCRRRDLGPVVTEGVSAYITTMRTWVAGVTHWHRQTHRYTPSYVRDRYERLRRRALSGPRAPVPRLSR